jgi:hypothetical protein
LCLDDDVRLSLLAELLGCCASDTAVRADDVVVLQAVDAPLHPSPPQWLAQLARHDQLGDDRDGREERQNPGQDEADRENTSTRTEWTNLAEADGGERGDGHVQAVEQRPVFDQAVPDGADRESDEEQQQRQSEANYEVPPEPHPGRSHAPIMRWASNASR